MSEVTDLAAPEGQTDEAPAQEEASFGFTPEPDTAPEAPEEQSGQPEDTAAQSTEDTPDEGGYLRQQDYTRKTQDLADQRKAFEAERQAFHQEMQGQREQIQLALQAIQSGQTTPNRGLVGQLQEIAADPNLSMQDRAGLNVIANLATELEAAKQTIQELAQFREDFSQRFNQTSQAVNGLTQAQHQAQLGQVQDQYNEAVELFGRETVDGQMNLIRRLAVENGQWAPETNPQTGKPFTMAELVAMGSGRLAEDAQAARDAQKNGKASSKKKAAPTGSSTGGDSRGSFSQADAIAEIAATQRSAG